MTPSYTNTVKYLLNIEAEAKWLPFSRWHLQMHESIWISTEISLKFVPMGPINNIAVLV